MTETPAESKVVDLMDALERSLIEAREARDRAVAARAEREDCGCD